MVDIRLIEIRLFLCFFMSIATEIVHVHSLLYHKHAENCNHAISILFVLDLVPIILQPMTAQFIQKNDHVVFATHQISAELNVLGPVEWNVRITTSKR